MRWIQGLGLDGVGRRGAELGSWRGWVDMELGGMNCFVLAPSVFFLGRQGGDEVSLLQMDASVVFQSEVAGGLGIATPPRKSRYFMSSKSHTRHRWETAFVQVQQKQSAHAILTTPLSATNRSLPPTSNHRPKSTKPPNAGARRDEPSVEATPVAAGQPGEWNTTQARQTAAAEKESTQSSLVSGAWCPTSVRMSGVLWTARWIRWIGLLPTPVARDWVDGGGDYAKSGNGRELGGWVEMEEFRVGEGRVRLLALRRFLVLGIWSGDGLGWSCWCLRLT